MNEVLKNEDNEIERRIASIKEKMECPREFECLGNGFENFFRGSNFTGGDFPECKEKIGCQFKSKFGFLYLCRCPLRMHMFSRIKIERPAGMPPSKPKNYVPAKAP